MIPNGYLYHMNKNKIKNKMSIFTLCNTLGHGHYLSRAPWLNLGWIFISIIKAICKISQLWYGITHKGPNHIEILNYLINLHWLTQSRLNTFLKIYKVLILEGKPIDLDQKKKTFKTALMVWRTKV